MRCIIKQGEIIFILATSTDELFFTNYNFHSQFTSQNALEEPVEQELLYESETEEIQASQERTEVPPINNLEQQERSVIHCKTS